MLWCAAHTIYLEFSINFDRREKMCLQKMVSGHFKIVNSAKMHAIVKIIMYVLHCNPFLSCFDNIDGSHTTPRQITSIYLLG